ncbi:MAG: hypothetical protein VYA55_05045 [Pseudomonadota bacterium]|nr:hypothetical protein [Pseudomonadota bacterium]
MSKHQLQATRLLRVLPSCFFASNLYADDMGGLQNPIVLLVVIAMLFLFIGIPLLAWVIAISILKRKAADKEILTGLKIDTFVSLFLASVVGFSIFYAFDGFAPGILLPFISSIIVVIYAKRKSHHE